MKLWRVVYLAVMLASLGAAFTFYYQYQLKDEELAQFRSISRLSEEALRDISRELLRSKEELLKSLEQIERLNKSILAYEKDSLTFRAQLEALKTEREELKLKVAQLIEKEVILEARLIDLEQKFHSLAELKKALNLARKKKRSSDKLARIQMLKELDELALQLGNRGFLLKDSQSTFKSARIRVKLEPVEKLSYNPEE